MKNEEEELYQQLRSMTEQLSEKRRQCAAKMERLIEAHLADLNMERTKFVVEIAPAELGETGTDAVEFKLSPNLGEALKPLAKIASGGEMSRIMLAIKNSLVQVERIPALVFDEVDTGIGGRTALKVAEKLRSLSKQFQVFAVTHLPIVASYAQHHYYVEKHEINGRTAVKVTLLDEDGRVNELVRMLGGQADQLATRAHAKELLQQAATS